MNLITTEIDRKTAGSQPSTLNILAFPGSLRAESYNMLVARSLQ